MNGAFRPGLAGFAVLLLFDQASKLLARTLLHEGVALGWPWLGVRLGLAGGTLFSSAAGGVMPYWLALALGALATLLALWAAARAAAWGSVAAAGWVLLAGGLGGHLLDGLLFPGSTAFLFLRLGSAHVTLNFADLSLLAGGLCLAVAGADWASAPRRTHIPLLCTAPQLPDFSALVRGVDNVHVDVRISPLFCTAARELIASLMTHEMVRNRHGEKAAAPSRHQFESFRTAYRELVTNALRRAGERQDRQLVNLMQFAVLKLLKEEVPKGFDAQLVKLRAKLQSSSEGRRPDQLVLFEQVFATSKARQPIEQRVNRQLMAQLEIVEGSTGTALRESLFGESWLLSREMLFNPLLQSDPNDDRLVMHHYVLAGKRSEERRSLARFEQFVAGFYGSEDVGQELFPGEAEQYAWLSNGDWATCAENLGWGTGQAQAHGLWTDLTANVDILFNPEYAQEARQEALAGGDRALAARWHRQRRFQRRAALALESFCRREGLYERVLAACEMVPVYEQHYAELNPLLLFQFLLGGAPGRNALQQIGKLAGSGPHALSLKPLQALRRQVRHISQHRRRAHLLHFVRRFLAYRRDLRNYCIAHVAMEEIHLVEEAEEARLSLANNCLQEFLTSEEAPPTRERVRAHTVIKADLRGSTVVTQELLDRGLNPATHFDRSFFSPINDLLRRFGAEKVFVEGDAVIAAVLEYEDDRATCMSVARACGVAEQMISVVEAHNRASARQGLPELQLGIGIAFERAAPSYIFEGDKPIMISPAIGRADRLSSSSWQLREGNGGAAGALGRVQVFELERDHPLHGEKGQTQLRHNVNGVLLEEPAYEELGREIRLQPVQLEVPGSFEAGRYPDAEGVSHPLLIRRGDILSLGRDGPGGPTGGHYFEVEADDQLLAAAARCLSGRNSERPSAGATAS